MPIFKQVDDLMEEMKMAANECRGYEDKDFSSIDHVEMMEITQAINDLDGKLRDLEIALHMDSEDK